ncbi:MAG: hypothetical protein QM766_11025 [Burkholderiaceae bacterium]
MDAPQRPSGLPDEGRRQAPPHQGDADSAAQPAERYSTARIKSSIKAFALGKAISAPLTFLLIVLLAAVMPRPEYAAYVAGAAALEIGIVLGTCGMDWFIQTSLTRINVNGSRRQLRRAIGWLNVIVVVPYLLLAAGGWLFSERISAAMSNVVPPGVIELYALVLLIEGPTRMLRDQMLSALLRQRAVQISQIVRTVIVLGGVLAMMAMSHEIAAVHIASLEIVASIFALVIAAWALIELVLEQRSHPDAAAELSTWFNRGSYRLAASAYGSFLLMMLTGTELTTALVARYLGADATAAFGFVCKLMETSRKYLPMDMFYGVLRPATIGRYEGAGRDFKVLMSDVNRMLDANLIVLGAGLAVAIAAGDMIVGLLSNHNVVSPLWLFATLLLLLIGHSVRRGIELLCYTAGHSGAYLRGAFSCLLIPPMLVTLMPLAGHPHVAPLIVCAVDVIFVAIVVGALRGDGLPVRLDLARWARLALSMLLAGALGWLVGQYLPAPAAMAGAIALSTVIFCALVYVLKVVDVQDLNWARSLTRRGVPDKA